MLTSILRRAWVSGWSSTMTEMQELQHSKSSSSPSWTPRPSRCQSRPISHNLSCHSENVWGKPPTNKQMTQMTQTKQLMNSAFLKRGDPVATVGDRNLTAFQCPGKPNSFQWFWTPPALPPFRAPDDPLSSRLPSRWTSGKYFESSNLDEAPGVGRHIGIPHGGTMTVRTGTRHSMRERILQLLTWKKYVGANRCKQD
jgi:hypothetical protein